MGPLPFFVLRPVLLVRGILLDRGEPDLERLAAIDDPERFGWAVLPHVARSFAASILMLPKAAARAARVGYLYARMIDTCEDMVSEPAQRVAGLEWFARRFSTGDLSTAVPAMDIEARTPRQAIDRLLVERCDLVDRLYVRLPEEDQARIGALVTAMADSMRRWGDVFARQGGVLADAGQLSEYCDDVIGEPARFAVGLLVRAPLSARQHRRLSAVSEFVQLANVTRDLERDLERGIGYHPSLRPILGVPASDGSASVQLRRVREELLLRALRCAPAYAVLLEELPLPRVSAVRGSAVLMLLFTERYYRGCAARAGHEPWAGSDATIGLLGSSVLAMLSRGWARRVVDRVESRFRDALTTIGDSVG